VRERVEKMNKRWNVLEGAKWKLLAYLVMSQTDPLGVLEDYLVAVDT
jgi:hypothetical protein